MVLYRWPCSHISYGDQTVNWTEAYTRSAAGKLCNIWSIFLTPLSSIQQRLLWCRSLYSPPLDLTPFLYQLWCWGSIKEPWADSWWWHIAADSLQVDPVVEKPCDLIFSFFSLQSECLVLAFEKASVIYFFIFIFYIHLTKRTDSFLFINLFSFIPIKCHCDTI